MSDLVLIFTAAVSVISFVVLIIALLKGRSSPAEVEDSPRPRGEPVNRDGGVAQPPRRAGRNVRARMRAAASREQEEEDDEEEDLLADEIAMPDGKIGAKKRRKLEMKAEKRQQRERDLEEREERKQRQVLLEEQRKKEEEREKAEEAKKEEEEKRLREEKEQQELEEYLKLKEAFSIEEEGFDEQDIEEESHKFQEFIDYIKDQKVVLLEDLAGHFKLKTQDAIDRVQELLSQELLIGVIDDRGKFIYITKEELEGVARFISKRGRVSISELVECSNTLINLHPDSQNAIAVT